MRRMEFFAHRLDVALQRSEIAFPLQYFFADRLEFPAHAPVAGGEARARQRLVFPGPGALFLIAPERRDQRDQQAGSAARAQREIGLEENARRGAAGEPVVEALREARIDFAGALVLVVVEKDDVEIRGIAELLAAELAVRDHGEARRVLAVAGTQVAPHLADRLLEHRVGKRREVIGEPLYGEPAGEVLGKEAAHLRLGRFAQDGYVPL